MVPMAPPSRSEAPRAGVELPKPPARDEARNALCDGGVRACEICRPDSERGIVN
ncbi:DUF6233 domain-containing protein [Streptomyces sp. NBC_01142]|uniref:DUF6233 domain-containing protein n=1 Tax=Streptomyces sp. NBC_01142 TaxID=2975865 RepID=UPI003390125E